MAHVSQLSGYERECEMKGKETIRLLDGRVVQRVMHDGSVNVHGVPVRGSFVVDGKSRDAVCEQRFTGRREWHEIPVMKPFEYTWEKELSTLLWRLPVQIPIKRCLDDQYGQYYWECLEGYGFASTMIGALGKALEFYMLHTGATDKTEK